MAQNKSEFNLLLVVDRGAITSLVVDNLAAMEKELARQVCLPHREPGEVRDAEYFSQRRVHRFGLCVSLLRELLEASAQKKAARAAQNSRGRVTAAEHREAWSIELQADQRIDAAAHAAAQERLNRETDRMEHVVRPRATLNITLSSESGAGDLLAQLVSEGLHDKIKQAGGGTLKTEIDRFI